LDRKMMESYIGPEVLGFWEVLMPGGKRFTDSQPMVLSRFTDLRDEFCTQLAHYSCP